MICMDGSPCNCAIEVSRTACRDDFRRNYRSLTAEVSLSLEMVDGPAWAKCVAANVLNAFGVEGD